MTKLLHLRQPERERLQQRRDRVYDELQRLYAKMATGSDVSRAGA